MSRLRRLKKNRKEKVIIATMSSLALMLAIGIMQTSNTFAVLTDTKTLANNLEVKVGRLDVAITQGFDKALINLEDELIHDFIIKNDGTLKQNISLELGCSNEQISEYINYQINFEESRRINPINGKLKDLLNKKLNVDYIDGSLFILDAKKSVDAYIKLTIDKNIPEDLLNIMSQEALKIDFKVLASQINNTNIENKGFTDSMIQENYLVFKGISAPNTSSKPKTIEQPKEENIVSEVESTEFLKKEDNNPIKADVINPPKEE